MGPTFDLFLGKPIPVFVAPFGLDDLAFAYLVVVLLQKYALKLLFPAVASSYITKLNSTDSLIDMEVEVESTVYMEGVTNGSSEEPSCSGWPGHMSEEKQDVIDDDG